MKRLLAFIKAKIKRKPPFQVVVFSPKLAEGLRKKFQQHQQKKDLAQKEESSPNPNPPQKTADQLVAELNEASKREGTYLEEREGEENEMQVVFFPKKPNSSGQKSNPENSSKESESKKEMTLDKLRQRASLEFEPKGAWEKLTDVLGIIFDLSFRFFIYTVIAVVVLGLIILFFQYGF